jgi:hypothetical protein
MSEDRSVLRDLNNSIGVARRYACATKYNDFAAIAGDHICAAALSIMLSLGFRPHSRVTRRMLKRIWPRRYRENFLQSGQLFAEADLFVVNKLREFINRLGRLDEGNSFLEEFCTLAGVHWYKTLKMSDDRSRQLLHSKTIHRQTTAKVYSEYFTRRK